MMTIVFLLVFCVMTPISVYLWARHGGNRLVLWSAVTLLFAGAGGLQVLLEDVVLPLAAERPLAPVWLDGLARFSDKLNMAVHAGAHWSILVFFLHYAGVRIRYAPVLLAFPALFSVWQDQRWGYDSLTMNYPLVLSWAVPYALISWLLLAAAAFRDRNRSRLPRHAAIAAIFLVPQAALLWYQSDGWFLHAEVRHLTILSVLLLCSALLVIVLYVRQSFLGVRREAVHNQVQVGTKMLQHAFKNAAGKVKLNALNARRSLQRQRYEEADDYLSRLLEANEHLMAMMDRLAHLTRKSFVADMSAADLRTVVREAAAPYGAAVVYTEPETAFPVAIDAELVRECLTNLIENAREAMNESGFVTLRLQRKGRRAALSVTDSGPGMDAEQLANATEPFYSTKSKSGRNFGLGLYYVKKVMQAHGGKLLIDSAPGRGTTVTLAFPQPRGETAASPAGPAAEPARRWTIRSRA